ncbi:MAG: hypothetical protein KBF66_07015 [Rhodoferax sp.]|uniref:hypothetical protein n=1 Tax=Rhodoferax sp. TaxID=50421 RepID=UPI001B3F2C6B|nr:hypothetical protein [Rhodoferax sp.]MBP9905292.1 hypothetical protein [Rhodoferax sp.]
MIKNLYWSYAPVAPEMGYRARLLMAAVLRAAGLVLTRIARRLAAVPNPRPRAMVERELEFYAEAGAPEGALYADGVLIGYVSGVKRL